LKEAGKVTLEVGDVVAIGALIASSLIFWFGYVRARKSEQIKIAREHMDRMNARCKDFEERFKKLEDKFKDGKEDFSPNRSQQNAADLKDYVENVDDIRHEIAYFDLLVMNHEILDKHVLSYYAPRITKVLTSMIAKLRHIEEMERESNQRGVSQDIFSEVKKLMKYLDNKKDTWGRRSSPQ
jgi:hypothetical protein